MPLTVHFVRHGESQANVDRVFANRADFPAPLTTAGVKQAHMLADTLAGLPVTHVYTSPLLRARQTADVIGARIQLEPIELDALREYDVGKFEGMRYGGEAASRWLEYERVDEAWRRGSHHARLGGGESLGDIRARFTPFMERIVRHHAASDLLAVVSHGGLYRVMFPLLFDEISTEYARARTLGHCASIVAVWEGGVWRCIQWGEEMIEAPNRP